MPKGMGDMSSSGDDPAGIGVSLPARIAIIALAAGASRRFGSRDKLLQPIGIGGEPLVVRVLLRLVRVAHPSAAIEIVAVVPDLDGAVARAIRTIPAAIRLVANPDRDNGLGASVAAGIASLAGGPIAGGGSEHSRQGGHDAFTAAVVTPCDMPNLTAALVERLIAAFLSGGDRPAHAVLPAGTPVSPMVWPRRMFPALMALDGDRGGRHLLAGQSSIAVPVDADELLDIDTAQDLAAYKARD